MKAVVWMEGGRRLVHGTVALTVHGPSGALDLVVPPEASVDDVAREYAAKAGLQFAPTLHSRLGTALVAGSSLAELGIRSGDVLAAGGVFMNVKANKRIAELSEVKSFEAFPSCGDETLTFGGYYLEAAARFGDATVQPISHFYLGDDVRDSDALAAAQAVP